MLTGYFIATLCSPLITMNKKSSFLFWLLIIVPSIFSASWSVDMTEQFSKPESLTLPGLIYNSSEHFIDIESVNLVSLLERIGDSRLVLLGESSHGTSEFYDMRARITRELIEKKGFTIIAAEADWPDAENLNRFVFSTTHDSHYYNRSFSRFPRWMWINHSVNEFSYWLKNHNQSATSFENKTGFYGLDLYNLKDSMAAINNYLQSIDSPMLQTAHQAYDCLIPWVNKPSSYGRKIQSGHIRDCEFEVNSLLLDLYENHTSYKQSGTQQFFSALQNARLVVNAERYYRTMNQPGSKSWNQRDQHMFETLLEVLNHRGPSSKAIIWAHNLHVGDGRAMGMTSRGEFNLGQRVREAFGDNAYLIGFGTYQGTVAAAPKWGETVQIMHIPPARHNSYEQLFHEVKADNFMLPLRHLLNNLTQQKLMEKRLQRAIGVVYDPETDYKRNYSDVSLPEQFDEFIWFDETRAVKPLR